MVLPDVFFFSPLSGMVQASFPGRNPLLSIFLHGILFYPGPANFFFRLPISFIGRKRRFVRAIFAP